MANVVDNTDDDSDPQENGLFNNTRRQFVAGSVALGGLAVGTGLAVPSLAQDEEPSEPIQNEFEDDIAILNYALTLERLEAEFYTQGLENLSEEDFAPGETSDEASGEDTEVTTDEGTNETASQDTNVTSDGGTNETSDEAAGQDTNVTSDGGTNETSDGGMNETSDAGTDQTTGEAVESAYSELQTIQEHEQEHVETLEAAIQDLGGEPAPEPETNFGSAVEDPMEFLETAVQLEDLGVSAYAGAAPFIRRDNLVVPALSIHSVEAKHAGYLRTLTGQTAFPNAFDQARSRSEVLDLAGQYIDNVEEFEPSEPQTEEGARDGGTPDISVEEFRNQTEDGEVGNETDGGMGNETGGAVGNETEGGVGNETDGNTTGGNTTDT